MSQTASALPVRLRGKLPSVPLPVASLAVRRLVSGAYRQYPDFFERLGQCKNTVYLIDPLDLSFALTMQLDSGRPHIRAWRRQNLPACAARISGSFHDLLALLQGDEDSDAMFFSRRLLIEGDTEAIVTLRNALDNLNADIVSELVSGLRPPLRLMAKSALWVMHRQHHARQ